MILNNIDNLIHITENIATETSEQIAKSGLHALGHNIHTALSNTLTGFNATKELKRLKDTKGENWFNHSLYRNDLRVYHDLHIRPIKFQIKKVDDQIKNETNKAELERLNAQRDGLNKQLDRNISKLKDKVQRTQNKPDARGFQNFRTAQKGIVKLNKRIAPIQDSKSFKTGQFIANHEKAIGGATLTTGGVIGMAVNKGLHHKESKENDSSANK